MLPIIQKEVVETKGWMGEEEFLDAIFLTNSLPGPLATNSTTFVGCRLFGVAAGDFVHPVTLAIPFLPA